MKFLAAIVIIFFVFPFVAYTQSAHESSDSCDLTINVSASDKETGVRIDCKAHLFSGAEVTVQNSETGFVAFQNICKGSYTLIVSSESYVSDTSLLTVFESFTVDVRLSKRIYQTDKIVIQDEALLSDDLPVGVLKGEELEKTFGESLARSLSRLTGVTSLNTGSSISKPVIHGFSGNRILIMNNGVRLEGQQWGSEHAPEIDPMIGRELSVIKGASTVMYGQDAIGGVIMVDPGRLPYGKILGGELNLVGFSNGLEGVASAVFESGIKNAPSLAYRLQGTLKKSGNISTPDYTLLNTGYEEANFSASLGYSANSLELSGFFSTFNSKIGIYSGSHIGNLTDLERAINSQTPFYTGSFSYQILRPYQNVNHNLLKLETSYMATPRLMLSADFGYQRNVREEYDSHGDIGDDPELYFSIDTYTLDMVSNIEFDNSMSGVAGVSGITQYNIGKGRPLIPNFESWSVGSYYVHKYIKNGIQLEAGVRYDYKNIQTYFYKNNVVESNTLNYSNFSGKLGAMIGLTPDIEVSVYGGTAWRPPSVNELYSNGLHHGSASIEIGDPNLQSEYGLNLTGTIRYDNKRNLSVESSLYTNLLKNFIYLEPRLPATLTIRGAFPTFYYVQGDSYINGLDLDLVYSPYGFLELNSKVSIVRAFNKSANNYIPLIPPDRFENSITLSKEKSGILSDISGTFSLITVLEQTRVPPNSDYAPPPGGYNIVNLDAGATINAFGSQFRTLLVITNLFDLRYRDCLNRFRYFTDEMGRNISLKIVIPFGSNL